MALQYLCLAALAALCLGARLHQDPQEHEFYACEEEGYAVVHDCSQSPGVPSRQMDELLEEGYHRMRAVAAAGRRPLALHIGADGLGNAAKWTDVHLYTRVLNNSGLTAGLPHLAFVEPIEAKAKFFWLHASTMPVHKGQVSLVTAMVDGHCQTPTKSMYRLSPQAGRDFDFETRLPDSWVSTVRGRPLEVVAYWADSNSPIRCFNLTGQCRSNFQRFRHAPNVSDYVEEVQVPCKTAADLIRGLHRKVEDLTMLVIDAEGLDSQILLALLGEEGFRPGFIMWETAEASSLIGGLDALLSQSLRKKGYQVGIKTGALGQGSDARNAIAVLA